MFASKRLLAGVLAPHQEEARRTVALSDLSCINPGNFSHGFPFAEPQSSLALAPPAFPLPFSYLFGPERLERGNGHSEACRQAARQGSAPVKVEKGSIAAILASRGHVLANRATGQSSKVGGALQAPEWGCWVAAPNRQERRLQECKVVPYGCMFSCFLTDLPAGMRRSGTWIKVSLLGGHRMLVWGLPARRLPSDVALSAAAPVHVCQHACCQTAQRQLEAKMRCRCGVALSPAHHDDCRPWPGVCRRFWMGAACAQPANGGRGGSEVHRAGEGGYPVHCLQLGCPA